LVVGSQERETTGRDVVCLPCGSGFRRGSCGEELLVVVGAFGKGLRMEELGERRRRKVPTKAACATQASAVPRRWEERRLHQ
jgi:uncharacterized protein YjlB